MLQNAEDVMVEIVLANRHNGNKNKNNQYNKKIPVLHLIHNYSTKVMNRFFHLKQRLRADIYLELFQINVLH